MGYDANEYWATSTETVVGCIALAGIGTTVVECLIAPSTLEGTSFQIAVWEALRRVPYREVRTYGEVAASIGRPGAYRAVANACAANRIALLVPCHRVVPTAGGTGGYAWGAEAKRALLDMERERRQ
jgi:AraC family transcriptional regulator of adaptative response/methylated-DNA-[protein]-cysteine methyltransferase